MKKIENTNTKVGAIYRECAGSRGYEEMAWRKGCFHPRNRIAAISSDLGYPLPEQISPTGQLLIVVGQNLATNRHSSIDFLGLATGLNFKF